MPQRKAVSGLRSPNHLRELMDARNLSMIRLGGKAVVSETTLARIINADAVPNKDLRQRIATVLGVNEQSIWPDIARIQEIEQGVVTEDKAPVNGNSH